MNKSKKQYMEEKGLTEFRESFNFIIKQEDIIKLDNYKLVESKGKQYEARAILKNIPISKYTENLNNRIYSKKLWEVVVKKKMGEGSLSLMGHPEKDGNPKDIAGVWHGLRVEEDSPKADLYLIGPNGDLILETLKALGKIGTSSVGYGTLDTDDKTVVAETYDLDRVGDLVLTPSQQVYATIENLDETTKIKENIENIPNIDTNSIKTTEIIPEKIEKSNNLTNESTNKYDIRNNFNVNDKGKRGINMDKVQEAQFKNLINEQVKNAKKNENLFEAINDLKAIDTAENIELTTKVDSAISEIQTKIASKENVLKEELDSKVKELSEVSDKYNEAIKVADELKEKLNKVSSFIEQVVEAEEDFNSETFVENYKVLIKDQEDFEKMLESDNFKKYEIDCLNDFEGLIEDTIKRDEDLDDLKEQIKTLEEDDSIEALKTAKEHIVECETKLEEFGFKFEEAEDKKDDSKDEEPKDDEKDDKKKKKDDDMKDEKDEKKEEVDKAVDKKDEEPKKDIKESITKYSFFGENKKEVIEETDNKEKKIQESAKITKDIKGFYEAQIKKFPGLKDFEKEVLESKSLIEAVNVIDDLKENINEMVDFKTIKNNQAPSWFRKGSK